MTAVAPDLAYPRQVAGTLTLASSLTHGGDETLGNTKLLRTKGVIYEGRRVQVPMLSGNALRGIWRRACALAFLDEYLAQGGAPLSLSAFYFLTSGGALKKGTATGALHLDHERELRALIPHVGLFGGAGLGRIQAGKLWIDEAVPVCRETVPILRHLWPAVTEEPTAGISIRELTEIHGYSRQDDAKQDAWHRYLSDGARAEATGRLVRGETDDTASEAGVAQQMRYEQMELCAGTVLYHRWGFSWPPTRDELAGLAAGLLRWAERAHAGGRNAVGHGNLIVRYQGVTPETRLVTDGAATLDVLRETTPTEVLRAHVATHRDAITEILAGL